MDDLFIDHFGKYMTPDEIRQLEVSVMADVYGIHTGCLVAVKVAGVSHPKLCRVLEELSNDFVFKALVPSKGLAYEAKLKVVGTENDGFVECEVLSITKLFQMFHPKNKEVKNND